MPWYLVRWMSHQEHVCVLLLLVWQSLATPHAEGQDVLLSSLTISSVSHAGLEVSALLGRICLQLLVTSQHSQLKWVNGGNVLTKKGSVTLSRRLSTCQRTTILTQRQQQLTTWIQHNLERKLAQLGIYRETHLLLTCLGTWNRWRSITQLLLRLTCSSTLLWIARYHCYPLVWWTFWRRKISLLARQPSSSFHKNFPNVMEQFTGQSRFLCSCSRNMKFLTENTIIYQKTPSVE